MKKVLTDEQKAKRKKKRILGWSITAGILAIVITLCCILVPIYDTNKFGSMVGGLIASYFKPLKNDNVLEFQEKHGFMLGVCHAPYSASESDESAAKQVTDANIEWTRIDISWAPYEKDSNGEIIKNDDGSIKYNEDYQNFRNRCAFYATHGIKVMAVTPYPKIYYQNEYDNNIDVTEITEEKSALMAEHAAFYASDLKGLVGAFQISNELYHSHFHRPLKSLELSAKYVGIYLNAMSATAKQNNIALGYNVEMFSLYSLTDLLEPYMDKIDYIGVDLYFGCFESYIHGFYMYQALIRALYERTGKPIIMAEFGYISKGAEKTEDERNALLQSYGYADEAAVKNDMVGFIKAFATKNPNYDEDGNLVDSTLVKEAKALLYDANGNATGQEDAYNYLFNTDKRCHVYNELPSNYYLKGYPHTYEGQAKFFSDFIPYLYDLDCVVGMFIYCYAESSDCYMCKQSDCPIETAWGLVDCAYKEKPSYYAVQEQFGIIKEQTANGTRYK